MVYKLNADSKKHFYHTIKLLAEFGVIPLHYYAIINVTAAITIGCVGLSAFALSIFLLTSLES
jgi:hypothetical protein